jgi:hypothetical protein
MHAITGSMAGENLLSVDDAHLVKIGEHGEGAADMGMRDRIVVEIEAHIGPLASGNGDAFEQRKGIVREPAAPSSANLIICRRRRRRRRVGPGHEMVILKSARWLPATGR